MIDQKAEVKEKDIENKILQYLKEGQGQTYLLHSIDSQNQFCLKAAEELINAGADLTKRETICLTIQTTEAQMFP